MGRKRKDEAAIIATANGLGVAWSPTVGFIGDQPLSTRAHTAALYGLEVRVHPMLPPVEASIDNPISAYAAMSWACQGREVILKAPDELLDALGEMAEDDFEAAVPYGQVEEEPTDLWEDEEEEE